MDRRDWHDWCTAADPAEPPRLTVRQWKALTNAQRRSQITQLERWVYQSYFRTAQFGDVAAQLNTTVRENALTPPGAKDIPVVTGPNTIGKSTFIMSWARHRYREAIAGAEVGAEGRPIWHPSPEVECDFCPVVFIDLGANTYQRALDALLLAFFGLPGESRVDETTRSAMKAIARHRVQIVVIDDVNLLKVRTSRTARVVLDHIKEINTSFGKRGASLVLVGANLLGGELLSDPQINGRSTTLVVAPYEIDNPDQQRTWQRVLREIENQLLPYLPAGKEGMLYQDLASPLWFRTQGYFKDLSKLVRCATVAATKDGSHKILKRHLDAVRLSDRAQAEWQAMTTRSQRRVGTDTPAAPRSSNAPKSVASQPKAPPSGARTPRRSRSTLRVVEDQRP